VTASWDSSGSDHSGVYLRFGDWPHDERSFSPASGYHEDGVSVYDLDREGEPSIDHGLDRGHVHEPGYCDVDEDGHCQNEDPWGEPDNDPREEMQGRKTRAERARYYGSDRPDSVGHLVRGRMSGVGYDGEPLLKDVKRVGDWIDHRHLFIDTAGPHRLTRDEDDPDYKPPEEKPPYGYRMRHQGAREEQLAAMDPRTRATALAQEQVRFHHPRLTMPLDVKNGQSSEVLSSWLREHGHPGADEAYVAAHPNPGDMHSNTGRGPGGAPVAVLHPERWDYGTLAHEAAHMITDHQTGRRFGEPHGPEGAHGSQWAKNYATLLSRISKPAAGHFISLYRQHSPKQEPEFQRRDPRFTPRRGDAPAPGMAYLSVPHGTLHALPEGMQSREGGGEHHVTVAHLPRGMSDEDYEEVLRHAAKAAAQHPPLEGTLGGMETFPRNAGAETRRIAYVPASIPGLDRLHDSLSAVNVSPHREFKPHVTVAYLRKGEGNPGAHPEVPVRFTHLHVERNGEVTSFPLSGPNRMEREAAAEPEEPTYYHVSYARFPRGHMLTPQGAGQVNFPGQSSGEHVYMTGDRDHAETYRYHLWEQGYPEQHLYEVSPHGPVEPDPHDEKAVRTRHPVEVTWASDLDSDGNEEAESDWFNGRTENPGFFNHREAVSGYDGLTKRSGMIYLDLPPGTVRLVPGGVDDSHVTICYLGKDVSDEAFEEACRRTREAAARLAPMDGVLRGIDVFPPSKSSDGKVVAFVPAYIGSVGLLRRALEDLSASEHKDWRPHVTLSYMEEGDSLPAPHPAVMVRFDRVHVKRGDEAVSFPLTGGMQREAVADDLVDVYHHTSPESAREIWEQKRFEPFDEYNRVYGTNLPPGVNGATGADYGEAALHLRVPRSIVHQWPGRDGEPEHYYDIDADDIRPEHFARVVGEGTHG
jgi:2'-5' RNA ligase